MRVRLRLNGPIYQTSVNGFYALQADLKEWPDLHLSLAYRYTSFTESEIAAVKMPNEFKCTGVEVWRCDGHVTNWAPLETDSS